MNAILWHVSQPEKGPTIELVRRNGWLLLPCSDFVDSTLLALPIPPTNVLIPNINYKIITSLSYIYP